MTENASALLGAWTNFYLTTGSAAASLTGLMFVVITLVRRVQRGTDGRTGVATFSTPTVLHFGSALFISLVLSAPWHSLVSPAITLVLGGLYGVIYCVRVAFLTKRLTFYTADPEDWTWYTILPLVSYTVVLTAAAFLPITAERALFAIALGTLLLIFTGIRNAWDVVTYITIESNGTPE